MEREPGEPTAERMVRSAGDRVDLSHGIFHAPVIGAQYNYAPVPLPVTPADSWPRLRTLRRLALGIRPVRRFGDEPTLPPYVRRDADAELDRIVADRLRAGGLVVVTGEPLSGKSRTAWAALRRVGGRVRTRVHNAQPGADLRGLPTALRGRDRSGHHVVWLDDLEGHLGEQGLTAGLLAECVHEGVLVLATMRDEAYDTHRFGDGPAARVLSGAARVELTCRWSGTELARLAEAEDPRLVDARRHRGSLGVAQFLAVGPELWEEWRRAGRPTARPSGHQLVHAAVGMARCGVTAALRLSALEALTGGPVVAEDLAWAARPRLGVVGLLVPGAEVGTWRASGPLVADALRSPDMPPVRADEWLFAAKLARQHSRGDFGTVVQAGREALRTGGEVGSEYSAHALARLAALAGDDTDARFWYRRLADLNPSWGAHVFAEYLVQQGETADAVSHYETAAQAGNRMAAEALGPLLLARAEHWLARAAEAGSEPAATRLAALREALAEIPATVKE
ncbi:sel1 repeat family protein [Streptomyces sp. NPDC014995]|uniref:sel1 repeat family protein n=1 Tax=Streptomyces sp. NPDC014995 TaxID=3364936 RepID=UPI0036FF4851